MQKVFEGAKRSTKGKFGIVVSRFNGFVTKKLLKGCLDELLKCGVKESNIVVVSVPGAWEIPSVAMSLAKKKNIDAVICLGAVIRGETAHFDVVAYGACNGIRKVALKTGKPVVLGVLTTNNTRQAVKRSEGKNNKGREAALVAVEMVNTMALLRKI
jgi:6,7-dimethyl-8-ribityllumazine synthase